MMYDEAQEKFKGLKEEERFFFKITKSKKRKDKHETKGSTSSSLGGMKLFDVEKNHGRKDQENIVEAKLENDMNSSGGSDQQLEAPKKKSKLDYSIAKKIFSIVKFKKEPKKEEKP